MSLRTVNLFISEFKKKRNKQENDVFFYSLSFLMKMEQKHLLVKNNNGLRNTMAKTYKLNFDERKKNRIQNGNT